jgi:hypothetical protein
VPICVLGLTKHSKQKKGGNIMAQFMYLIRNEGADFSKYSANDFQELAKKYQAWTQKIKTEGRFLAGEKLSNDLGKSLRVKQREIVVDGPYADSKDAIMGFYIIEAKNLSEALEVGKGCPALSYGGSLEVREIDQM